ncbi:glycosyltransferase [Bacillaceae bacterium Marseille-Q3522]|nr:glycosyltransferase [Bacillaceae bacterium Marseille-Q3522]
MRVLWSVFITFPEVAELIKRKPEYACTWVRALADQLRIRDDFQLAVVSAADGDEMQKYEIKNITFYFLPNRKKVIKNGGGIKTKNIWKKIISDFAPDIIHVHGTESMICYELIMQKPNIPIFVTLQGVLTNYYRHEYGGIEMKDIISTTTVRDIVRLSGIILDKRKLKKRMKFEQDMLLNVEYVGGRTLWDKTSVLRINPNLNYLNSPELIRKSFYDTERWNIKNIKRHRIFMHQGFKPIKGFHYLIEALSILKQKYPDIEVYMSGTNILGKTSLKQKFLQTGYAKYLSKLIKKYDLKGCVHFTGIIDETEIVKELKAAHVMVLPSSIENSPNSLLEAMLVGVPCVASFVGGIPEMLKDNEQGFLYCYNEPGMLAEYISQLFESDYLAEKFSKASYYISREKQSVDYVVETTLNNYMKIINNKSTLK